MAIVMTYCCRKREQWEFGRSGVAGYGAIMSDTAIIAPPFIAPRQPREAKGVTLPKPQPFGAPVFMMDAVTPLAGETVLSLLWKRMAENDWE